MKSCYQVTFKELKERWPMINEDLIITFLKEGRPGMWYNMEEFGITKKSKYLFNAYTPWCDEIKLVDGHRIKPLDPLSDNVPDEICDYDELYPFIEKCAFNKAQVWKLGIIKPELRNKKFNHNKDLILSIVDDVIYYRWSLTQAEIATRIKERFKLLLGKDVKFPYRSDVYVARLCGQYLRRLRKVGGA